MGKKSKKTKAQFEEEQAKLYVTRDLEYLRRQFDLFDVDGWGTIFREDLQCAVNAAGCRCNNSGIKILSHISYDKFLQIVERCALEYSATDAAKEKAERYHVENVGPVKRYVSRLIARCV